MQLGDCTIEDFCYMDSMRVFKRNIIYRPIRPGLREEQKTFEEFVEEHLKTDQAVLQYENQV